MNGKIKKNNFKIQGIKWKCKYSIPRIYDLKWMYSSEKSLSIKVYIALSSYIKSWTDFILIPWCCMWNCWKIEQKEKHSKRVDGKR